MKTMFDPEDYAVACRRTRAEETGELVYEATVAELPDVIGYGETRAEAEDAVLEAIRGLQEMAHERGRNFPAPVEIPTEYTGRVTTRLSRTIHKQAAALANAEGISLNAFICEAVSLRVAMRLFESTLRVPIARLTNYVSGLTSKQIIDFEANSNVARASTEVTEVRLHS